MDRGSVYGSYHNLIGDRESQRLLWADQFVIKINF